jgi:hypothetical protein
MDGVSQRISLCALAKVHCDHRRRCSHIGLSMNRAADGIDERDIIICSWICAARLHLKRARGLRIILSTTRLTCSKRGSGRTFGHTPAVADCHP